MRTAEIRWWWRGDAPAALAQWLRLDLTPEPEARTDIYLYDPDQPCLGIKRRGARGCEVKALCGDAEVMLPRGVPGQAELWVKRKSGALALDGLPVVAVGKRRWKRVLGWAEGSWRAVESEAAAARGCGIELTGVRASGASWTTAGFEAFGDDAEGALRGALAQVGDWPEGLRAPDLVGGYPLWLSEI